MGPGSTVDLLQGSFDEIFAVAHTHGWDQNGTRILARVVQFGFDSTMVEGDLIPAWQPALRTDSRNGVAPPHLLASSSGAGQPVTCTPVSTNIEEELRRIMTKTELYEARKKLHHQEMLDASTDRLNHSEAREHTSAGSVVRGNLRFPRFQV